MNSLKVTGALTFALSAARVLSACGGQARTAAVGEGEGGTEIGAASPQEDARIVLHDVALKEWTMDASSNIEVVSGKVLLGGQGVEGVSVKVDDYTLTDLTAPNGSFTYPADVTVPHRYVVQVADATGAEVAGNAVSERGRIALERAGAGFNVAYAIDDLEIGRHGDSITVTGRLTGGNNASLTPALFAFSLTGQVTDANGEPVSDVWVSFRPADRETWTLDATDGNGRFHSFFFPSTESTEAGPYSVLVSRGDQSWEVDGGVTLDRLTSATVDMRMQRSTAQSMVAATKAESESGAYYETVLVGLAVGDEVVRPTSATWIDETGRFSLDFAADETPRTASLWVSRQYVFVDNARPGGHMDADVLPEVLGPHVPRGLKDVQLHD